MSNRQRSRSRSPISNSVNEKRFSGLAGRDTNSNDATALRRRVFVGNLCTDKTSKIEIEEIFGKFGTLESCSLHKNFGFIQFCNEKDADAAVMEMHGKSLFGKRIDVNLAGLRRKPQTKDKFEAPPKKDEVVPEEMMKYGKRSPPRRGRSPVRDHHGPPEYVGPVSPMSKYEELYRKEDLYTRPIDRMGRDPYGAPLRDIYPSRDELYPPRYERDYPPREDPYWRPPPPRTLRPAIDCEIIALSKDESRYAEEVEGRLRSIGLVCNIGYPALEVPVLEVIDRIAQAGTLYAVVVSGQNAQHRSCTLNILHGARQEHRNMPLNNALSFVARNFDTYLKALRDPYLGGPPQHSGYAPPRDEPRGYAPPLGGYHYPPVSEREAPPQSEKRLSNEELAEMIEKLKREKQQRTAESAPAVADH